MERVNEITLVLGMKGSGKSTNARARMADRRRKIWIDPMFEHTDGVVVANFADLVEYVEPMRHGTYSVILQSTTDGEAEKVVAFLTEGQPKQSLLPGCTILIDEIDKLCSPTSVPESIRRLFNYGRHFQVSVIGVSRRPKSIARDITANADILVIGKVQEPADLRYIEEFTNQAFVARAMALGQFEFVEWPETETENKEIPENEPPPEPVIPPVDPVGSVPSGKNVDPTGDGTPD